MRYLYATAAAIAPLLFACGANAQVSIDTTRTTPITTSNATGSGPANIFIVNGGMISLTSGTAVTIDSNHTFELYERGSISLVNSASGSTGILVQAGNTTTLTIAGTIAVTDTHEAEDTDKDGDNDGPFATGTDRYGIRFAGAGAVTGNLSLLTSSTILVEGNESFGISVESDLIGNLVSQGTIRVVGDNSMAVRSLGTIDGNVYLGGSITTVGGGSTAVGIFGDINGGLSIQGAITSSGYRFTSRPSDEVIAKLDADDLLQGGPAVIIASNVTGGVTFGRPPTNQDDDNPDEDNDGVPDSSETTAEINVYGEAPAVVVGSATQDVTLGVAGTGDLAYGFINQGQISAQGIYDGVTANAIQFGVDGGHSVFIEGGIFNSGTIAALAYDADAVAIRLSAGVSTDQFINNGALTAASASDVTSNVTTLLIEAGANLPVFINNGQFLASSGGGTADLTGILDLSGTLTSITNTGSMQANIFANDNGDPITGTTTLINVEANTTGVTLIQEGIVDPDSDGPDTDGDGVPDNREPAMVGNIRLGSGADLVDIRNGTVLGDISFGDGLDTFLISGGAIVRGAIEDSDGLLDITVANGVLDLNQTTTTDISNLTIGGDGRLVVNIDGNTNSASGFNVSGTATVEDGAELGVRFTSLIDGPSRFTVIDAGTLNFGNLDMDGIAANAPYLFILDAGADLPNNQVYVDVRRRTAEEAGFIRVEASAYDAIYEALDRDSRVLSAFLNQTGRDDFINLYEQMLPDHSGGPLLSLASGVDAVTRALVGRNASAQPGEASAWVQEITFYADKDKTDTYGFRSEGFGVAGGVEYGTRNGAVGVSIAFTSSDLEDPESEAQENLTASLVELGLYWRAQGQYWTTWARAAAGYASFDATRQLVGGGVNITNESSWNGYTLAAAGGASYERDYGRFTLRPEVYAEYFSLSEDAREEVGGGDGFDLIIDGRDGHMFSAVAAMNVAYSLGENSWLKPEFRIGWRQNISVDPGSTIARFASGGPSFSLDPDTIEGGGPIVGFRLNVGNELGMLSVSADAEMIGDYMRYMLLLRASFRF
ncbi:autotransporter outer membrane beta-barrel domain-containing protein [Brevundimonas sp.]|uniref:autotransporter outer membrane beta-barrel domain-containing protein n=1 Tax=Brevundimonas sp. TaxID=1871086 RepID=UPI001D6F8F9F|nr:autotransporter outer membrane beta-barrel domain-containing protein [Brevundimonas sp.]MBL0947806.1 autotransporter outer membrane beta-barrel domain-containing protein [Brevundimonas sp.]